MYLCKECQKPLTLLVAPNDYKYYVQNEFSIFKFAEIAGGPEDHFIICENPDCSLWNYKLHAHEVIGKNKLLLNDEDSYGVATKESV